jgi:hypothetical protein
LHLWLNAGRSGLILLAAGALPESSDFLHPLLASVGEQPSSCFRSFMHWQIFLG